MAVLQQESAYLSSSENFRLSLLEYRFMRVDAKVVIEKEGDFHFAPASHAK